MRRAKIVCTIGPASSDDTTIRQLIKAGMNVARLNFSHGTHDDHRAVYARVRQASREMGVPVAILQDLQGPKIRVGTFPEGGVDLTAGQHFVFTTEKVEGNNKRCSVSYPRMPQDVEVGQEILVDDGLLRMRVCSVTETEVDVKVLVGGRLKNRKGVNLPATRISMPSLTAKDRADLELGLELGVDFVALSFVRSPLDMHQLRCYLPSGPDAPHTIAKIEKPQAVDNLHAIIAASDGIMIARGDLGVELPPEQVPTVQKEAIDLANSMGKLTITATQMLESMTVNPRPTRAEASDVANAIFDGTDAVMLSGETAAGEYPVEAVKMMASIIREAEASPFIQCDRVTLRGSESIQTFSVAIARAATVAAQELNVSAISCFTMGGGTARLIKTNRPSRDVLAFTPVRATYNRMALYRGITPVFTDVRFETDSLIEMVEDQLVDAGIAGPGDHVIIVMGVPVGVGTPTNTIKFHAIPYDRTNSD